MEIVRIEHVERHSPGALLGCWLDRPLPDHTVDSYSFGVRGWAIAREGEVAGFEVREGGREIASVAPNYPRPDVAERFEDASSAVAGFEMLLSALDLPPSFAVEIVVRLIGGAVAPLATLRGRRRRIAVAGCPRLNPVMVTTIGRSGSKWLSLLISSHPSIVAYQPLVFEPRVATYWATALRTLAGPESYLRQIHTEQLDEPLWWLGDEPVGIPWPLEHGMADWLGSNAVHDLAAFCRGRVEAFYEEVAQRTGKPDAAYFVEKFPLQPSLLDLTLECFPGAREVILVRDFRDRLSSVFAWNERQGSPGFGHEGGMSKARYVAEKVLSDAEELLERWRRRGEAAELVRYEDLVTEPRATLVALFEHLGLVAGAETVDGVLEAAASENGVLDAHRTVADPSATIGRWRRDLPDKLAAECNEILAPALEAFGYETQAPGTHIAREEMAR